MRSFSDQCLLMVPAGLSLLLLGLFSAPLWAGSWPLAPNVGMVMTVVIVALYPPAWPRGFVFLLGLLQDVLCATPLGAQALILLLLVTATNLQNRQRSFQQFRLRWLEAAVILVVAHGALWAVLHAIQADAIPLRMLVRAGITNALWYPVFYGIFSRWALLLPPIR